MSTGTTRRDGPLTQRWFIVIRNHAHAAPACDFCAAVTATFRLLYVFVVLELGSWRFFHLDPAKASSDSAPARGFHWSV
jgi:hypothetical protein